LEEFKKFEEFEGGGLEGSRFGPYSKGPAIFLLARA
jgi:hypothetical protein